MSTGKPFRNKYSSKKTSQQSLKSGNYSSNIFKQRIDTEEKLVNMYDSERLNNLKEKYNELILQVESLKNSYDHANANGLRNLLRLINNGSASNFDKYRECKAKKQGLSIEEAKDLLEHYLKLLNDHIKVINGGEDILDEDQTEKKIELLKTQIAEEREYAETRNMAWFKRKNAQIQYLKEAIDESEKFFKLEAQLTDEYNQLKISELESSYNKLSEQLTTQKQKLTKIRNSAYAEKMNDIFKKSKNSEDRLKSLEDDYCFKMGEKTRLERAIQHSQKELDRLVEKRDILKSIQDDIVFNS